MLKTYIKRLFYGQFESVSSLDSFSNADIYLSTKFTAQKQIHCKLINYVKILRANLIFLGYYVKESVSKSHYLTYLTCLFHLKYYYF